MGKDSRRRSRSPSSSDSDSSREERHHKHKKSKKEHKSKHKKHKKHKRRSRSPDGGVDEQQLAAARAFLEQHLQQTGGGRSGGSDAAAAAAAAAALAAAAAGGSSKAAKKEKAVGVLPPGAPLLTTDDYFARSTEFTAWLQEKRGQLFNELTSQQTHAAFRDFVEAWNSAELPARFYSGLAAAPMKRTAHNWRIKKGGGPSSSAAAAAAAAASGAVGGAKTGMAGFLDDQQQQRAQDRVAAAADRRKGHREQRELLEELVPRATGGSHEARVEARMARKADARAREESPDLMAVPGAVMGGDDSFAAAKAREAKRNEWRNQRQAVRHEELSAKLSAAAQAEADKMAAFRALVQAQGGRISIPKRQ